MRDTPSDQERDLLDMTCISDEDRRDFGVARVLRGVVVQSLVAVDLAVAQRVGAIWSRSDDHVLRKETMPIACKRLVCVENVRSGQSV